MDKFYATADGAFTQYVLDVPEPFIADDCFEISSELFVKAHRNKLNFYRVSDGLYVSAGTVPLFLIDQISSVLAVYRRSSEIPNLRLAYPSTYFRNNAYEVIVRVERNKVSILAKPDMFGFTNTFTLKEFTSIVEYLGKDVHNAGSR